MKALRWVVTALIVVFLVIFARTIDWSSAWQSMRSASLPLLIAAISVNFLSIAVKGVRWWLFLKPAGSPSLGLSMRATIAGSGLNNVLVANGGDAARVVFVSRATKLSSSTVLATLALERLFDSSHECPANQNRIASQISRGIVELNGSRKSKEIG